MLNDSPALFTKDGFNNMQVNVRQYGAAKFNVILTDMDADMTAGVIICKTLVQAIEKANEMVK
jgi:hypothetical protein